jgi:uncharacterized membrane protein
MAKSQGQEKSAAAHGREALSQWGDAVRFGARALAAGLREREGSADRPRLRERLDPSKTEKGGRVGGAADAALARLGKPGKLASKLSLGSRLVERVGGGNIGNGTRQEAEESAQDESASNGDSAAAAVPFPIQESIDVALPVGGAFALASRFLDFPEYLDRMVEAEEVDETHFLFVVKTGRRPREIEVEIVEELPDSRIDWECDGELSHSGMLTFHPLAPRLTRLELTIEREPEGLPEQLWRRTRLTGRVIQGELHRFKAHVELLDEDFEDYVPRAATPDEIPPQEEAPEGEGEEPEEGLPEGEAEAPDEGQVEEEELEPA